MSAAYEEVKGRAVCAGIRLAVLLCATALLFPAGVWLMLEEGGASGALLCALAGLLASGVPDEAARAKRLTREAERLRWQGEESAE
jgi:hypothetical protein